MQQSSSVARHYQYSKKIEYEKILCRFVQETLIDQALARVLRLSEEKELHDFDFSRAELAMPRADTTPVRSKKRAAALVHNRPCYNKTKKKRCLSGGALPVFASASQVACDLCCAGYGNSGKYTPKAAKRMKLAKDGE